jgi:single-strand DNA-binding protein
MGRKNDEAHAGTGASAATSGAAINRVVLRGRVSTAAEERELPSGTMIVTVRLSVEREATPMTTGSRQRHDWVDCSAWGGRSRRTVAGWRTGDLVEVEGALRRRFSRAGGATSTRLEVEILAARTLARAAVAARGRSAAPG